MQAQKLTDFTLTSNVKNHLWICIPQDCCLQAKLSSIQINNQNIAGRKTCFLLKGGQFLVWWLGCLESKRKIISYSHSGLFLSSSREFYLASQICEVIFFLLKQKGVHSKNSLSAFNSINGFLLVNAIFQVCCFNWSCCFQKKKIGHVLLQKFFGGMYICIIHMQCIISTAPMHQNTLLLQSAPIHNQLSPWKKIQWSNLLAGCWQRGRNSLFYPSPPSKSHAQIITSKSHSTQGVFLKDSHRA